MTGSAPYRLAFDVGGTFTDIVLVDSAGALTIEKVLTTPESPEEGAQLGTESALARCSAAVRDVELAVHGTTLVTNAIIERRGAPTGMLTTAGFEDVIEIGLGERYDMYDLFLPFPEPIVERRLRLGVPERVDSAGKVITPLDEDSVRTALAALAAEGIEAVAVCFINAHANQEHEERAAAIAREAFPGARDHALVGDRRAARRIRAFLDGRCQRVRPAAPRPLPRQA